MRDREKKKKRYQGEKGRPGRLVPGMIWVLREGGDGS